MSEIRWPNQLTYEIFMQFSIKILRFQTLGDLLNFISIQIAEESLSNIRTVQAFGQEDKQLSR